MLRHALILESMGWGREVTPCQLSSPSVCKNLGALWICEVNCIVTLGYDCWNSSDNEEDLETLRAESDSFFLSRTLLAENAVILLQAALGVHVDCGIKWKSLSMPRWRIPQTLKETVGSFLVSFLQSVSPLGSLNLHMILVCLWNSGVKFLLLHHSSILVRDKVYLWMRRRCKTEEAISSEWNCEKIG